MGSVLASKIQNDAAGILMDRSLNRFGDYYLGWINDAQVMLAAIKPDASVGVRTKELVEGVYQTISSDAHAIIRPIRNMGIDGLTPGPRIDTVDYDHFTNNNPDWMDATASATVEVIMIDERNDLGFFCYPPQPEIPGQIQIVEAIVPATIAAIENAITINDIHEPHMLQYVLFRGNSVSTSEISKSAAMNAWNMFVTGLGRKDLVDKVISANTARKKLQGGQDAS